MKFQSILLSATFAAVASFACSPGGTGGTDAGPDVPADKFCLPTCAAPADCVITGTVAADWACESSQCVFIHYFDDGTYCGADGDCNLQFGGAFTECTAAVDCANQVCAKGYSNGKAYCMTAPIPGTFECTAIGADWEEFDTTDIDDADVTICVKADQTCGADGFCEVEAVEGDAGTGDGTCEETSECADLGDNYECVEPA